MKSKLVPRDYQQEAYDNIKKSFRRGNKHIALMMCGGSGKSLLCKMIIESALEKGGKIGFFSFRKSLTEQIKEYFDNVDNIDIGTLQKFGKTETDIYSLIILDEKDFTSTKLRRNIKSKFSIVMSGCPTDISGNVLEFDDIVEGIQYSQLLKKGYAKDIKVYSISTIDSFKLKKVGGDFHKGQSFEMMEKPKVKKDILESYKRYCIGRKSLMFAIDIKHAESLKEEFLKAGIKCESIHSKKKSDNIIKDFESGKFDLLINVAQISIGVDIPCVNTIIFARPLLSVPLFYQIIWRGTRKFNDDYCLVLDLADVLKRVGVHPKQDIDLTKTKQSTKKPKCKKCDGDLEVIEKKITEKSELSFKLTTYKRCKSCKEVTIQEELKIIDLLQCDNCLKPIDKNITMKIEDKKICFNYKCDCGFEKVHREILLSTAELKEIKHEEELKSEKPLVKLKAILKDEAKRSGYHHRWVERAMDILKDKDLDMVFKKIEYLRENNKKIGSIVYV